MSLGGGRAHAEDDATAGEAFHVARIEVDDVPEALRAAVDAAVAPYRDQQMSLGMVRNVAVKVTMALQDGGERLSYAYVPNQDIVDGVVHLKVLRGHIESASLGKNTSLVMDKVLKSYLAKGVSPTGDVPTAESQLLRLADLPGVGGTTPVLAAGQEPGGSALTVDVAPGERIEGLLVMDNNGSKTSGKLRMGTQLTLNSPLGMGDRFQAVLYEAPEVIQTNHDSDGGGHTWIGRLSYDLPMGADGGRAGFAYSQVGYQLGGETYRRYGFEGFAKVWSLYGSYPLIRTATRNLSLSANLDYKQMFDSSLSDDLRSASMATLQLSGDVQGQIAGLPNVLQYQFSISGGDFTNTPGDWSRTNGKFLKTTQSVKLSQGLMPGLYLDLPFSAQQASRNLDGSEKMSLGGPSGVRAFNGDVASVDTGWLFTPTVNWSVPWVDGLTAQLFYDYGRGTTQKTSNQYENIFALGGYGAGLSYALPGRAVFSASYARRDIAKLSKATVDAMHQDMFWGNIAVRY
nr:ShlB/FhaC/HecB family hemolysin secretion/activation protein [Andreprevotia chitinilytica]